MTTLTIAEAQAALNSAFERDQEVRKLLFSDGQDAPEQLKHQCTQIDADNTALLKEIIAQYGFPTISQFGERASSHAWCIAQHADRDPAFQQDVLRLMHPLVATREVSRRNYAFLYDRVAVATNQPQYYGTQFTESKDGKIAVPSPISGLGNPEQIINNLRDLAILNARRASAQLEPFEEYFQQMNPDLPKTYNPPTASR